MRIIDEKGRLFGKINLIDFLVILFLICLIPILYFGNKIFSRKSIEPIEKVFFEMEINCKFIKLSPDVLKQIAVGDKEIRENQEVIGEIIWLGEARPYQYKFNVGQEEPVIKLDQELKEIPAILKIKTEIRGSDLYYKNKQISINSAFSFKTDKYNANVTTEEDLIKNPFIYSIGKVFQEINCKFIKLSPDVLKQIAVGDKEIRENQEVIGEIIWLGEARPYQYKFNVGQEEPVIKLDQELKEIPAILKIKTEIRGSDLYYKDRKVFFNSYLSFVTVKYKIEAEVIRQRKEKKLELNFILKNVDPQTLKLIKVGDKEIGKDAQVLAEILQIGKIEDNIYEINLGDGNIIFEEGRNKKQVHVRMRLLCELDESRELYYRDRRITGNSLIEFNTGKYSTEFKIAPMLINEKWIALRVKFVGVMPEIANILLKGDEEKSPEGKVMARLNNIKSNKPTDLFAIRGDKYFFAAPSFLRDIEASLDLLCAEKEGVLYFKNLPVKIGNMVTFTTDTYSISGTIIGLGQE